MRDPQTVSRITREVWQEPGFLGAAPALLILGLVWGQGTCISHQPQLGWGREEGKAACFSPLYMESAESTVSDVPASTPPQLMVRVTDPHPCPHRKL